MKSSRGSNSLDDKEMKEFKRFLTYFDYTSGKVMVYDNLLMVAYPNAPLKFTHKELQIW